VRTVDLATQAARAYEAAVGEPAGDWMVLVRGGGFADGTPRSTL
jgi:hypothetical protein